MMDVEQIQAAVAIIEQNMKENKEDAGFVGAIGTILIATVGSLASIANSMEILTREVEQLKVEITILNAVNASEKVERR